MHDNEIETPVQSTECELLPDGRTAHYFQRRLDGNYGCVRCPAIAGKHGLTQLAAVAV